MTDLWLGHLAADLASGALPAVLVFLKPVLHPSYTKAGAAVLVLADFGSLSRVRRTGHARGVRAVAADRVGPFKVLLVTVGLRSVAYYGLFTFVPLWEVAQGHSKGYGAALLSLVLLGGAIGTLCSGPLADRYGDKLVLAGSLALTPALLVVFALSNGA